MGKFTHHEQCPSSDCGSTDGLARYEDGTGYCWVCHTYFKSGETTGDKQEAPAGKQRPWTPVHGTFQALPNRELKEATCLFWKYQVGERDGEPVHIMNVYGDHGRLIAQKFRDRDKGFSWLGDTKDPPLYGQWLWPSKGKSVTITEGEIDAMSLSQAFGNKWPVVSLPNGTGSVKKALAKSYDWLNGFESIVLMFDQDEPGAKAVEEALKLLPAGKVKIAKLPEKDANETMILHGAEVLTRCFWNATLWKPDGIVAGREFTRERTKKATAIGFKLRYPKLEGMTYGLRKAELTTWTAGAGIGKSTIVREIAYGMREDHGLKIGNIFLEEQNTTTVQAYVAMHNNVPLAKLRRYPDIITDAQYDEALEKVVWDYMWFYDHFGSLECDRLFSKMTYLAKVCGVDLINLDHISIVTSGLQSGSEGERKDIDILMTRLASFTQETGVAINAIVHLKRKQGDSFNDGAQISLTDLRGSAAIEQLSHNVYALERDQQADDPIEKCKALIRVLKCRETGDTGEADEVIYDRETGRYKLAAGSGFAATDEDKPVAF